MYFLANYTGDRGSDAGNSVCGDVPMAVFLKNGLLKINGQSFKYDSKEFPGLSAVIKKSINDGFLSPIFAQEKAE